MIKEYDGKLSISRVSGNSESYIEIKLDDAEAHAMIVKIKIPMEDFGAIITGLSYQPVKYQADNFDKLGKTMEFKTEKVYIQDCISLRDKENVEWSVRNKLPAFEINGWIADVGGSLGRQNSTGEDGEGKYVMVQFRRWV